MRIGITYTEHDDKFANYVRWMKGHDHGIEVLRLSPSEEHSVAELDGIVLSGGVDIHPTFYGGKDRYENMPRHFKEERDKFEFSVLDAALKSGAPVLGICRGLQLINVFHKGTLVQDMGAGNETHKTYRDEDRHEHDRTHHISTEDDTLLKGITGESDGIVNSAHHQCIAVLGDDLVANSYADDGTIEGIEWKNKNGRSFMLAVQWHPERMDKSGLAASKFSRNIREHFIAAIKSKVSTNENHQPGY